MIVAGWILAAVISDPSSAAVDITGTSRCPSAADVESALQGLIAPRDPELAADRATLTDDGPSVIVALQRASGEAVGEKRLDGAESCEQRARAAAVVIAAWEARLAAPAQALVVVEPGPPAPGPGPAAVVAQSPSPPAMILPSPPRLRVEPGVTVAAAINGTTLAPAAAVDVAFTRPDALLIPAVGALVVGSHTKAVGPGQGTWRRYGLLATVGSRTTWSATWFEARIGVAATLLDISGSSFPSNGSGFSFDPGVPIGARFGVRTRPVRWWIDAMVAFWPRAQTLFVSGDPGSTTLPRGEALLGLGAAYEGR
jgi:hypothetical protein